MTGHGFHGGAILGALRDGYNGEGAGVGGAVAQDSGILLTVLTLGTAGPEVGEAEGTAEVATEATDEGATAAKGLGNPLKGKSGAEVERMLNRKGYDRTGTDPANGKGNYVNPKTRRSYHIDPRGQGKYPDEPSHVDVHRPRGYKGPLIKRKLTYKDD